MKILKQWYSGLNIYYKLLPFLALYLIICIVFNKNVLIGDETRYLRFANNIINGNFSQKYAETNLSSGPGYPLVLVPFVFLKLPLIVPKLFNGVLLYLSLIISYKTFRFYTSAKKSLLFTILLGLYYPIYEIMPKILTECLSWLLVSLTCFLFIKNFKQEEVLWKYVIMVSVTIAYLAMTKVIFGYVITFMLFVSILMLFLPTYRSQAKKSTLIFLFSFILCLPWLFYTYNITNMPFYWTDSGGSAFYAMSTPYEGELGDWKSNSELISNPNHKVFIKSISSLNPWEMDKAFKGKAIKNIREHPIKYISNWFANVGRILFSYPFTGRMQTIKTYFTLIPNMFILVLLVFTIPISVVNYKKFPDILVLIFIFMTIYLLGSSFVSGFKRIFFISIPFWSIFLLYVFNNIIIIKARS